MSTRFIVLATCLSLLIVCASRPAMALWPLPWCFKMPPFTDTLVMNPQPTRDAQRSGSGRDLVGDRPLTISTFMSDDTLHVGFTIHPMPGYVPVVVGGKINPNTGIGTGQCYAPTAADCGNVTFTLITCPVEADAAATLRALEPPGRAMGELLPGE